MNKITFFGTGTSQGVPVIGSLHPVCVSNDFKDKRLRSSIYVEIFGKCILIDCGPDFRQQMLVNEKSRVDAILLTHEHNDHVLGLDDVRPINFASNKNMKLYGLLRVLNEVKMRFPYAFSEEKYPGIPAFDLYEVGNQNFFIDEIEIIPIEISHGLLSILGFRILNIAYITDASYIDKSQVDKLMNLDVLIINSLRKENPHKAHFILPETLKMIEKINPKKAYITHISHLMGFHEVVQKELPENIFLAYDGLEVEFD